MPFSEYYQTFTSTPNNADGCCLRSWKRQAAKNGEFYEKNGKQATFKYSVFGDDPTSKAVAQTIVQQLKGAGINVLSSTLALLASSARQRSPRITTPPHRATV